MAKLPWVSKARKKLVRKSKVIPRLCFWGENQFGLEWKAQGGRGESGYLWNEAMWVALFQENLNPWYRTTAEKSSWDTRGQLQERKGSGEQSSVTGTGSVTYCSPQHMLCSTGRRQFAQGQVSQTTCLHLEGFFFPSSRPMTTACGT